MQWWHLLLVNITYLIHHIRNQTKQHTPLFFCTQTKMQYQKQEARGWDEHIAFEFSKGEREWTRILTWNKKEKNQPLINLLEQPKHVIFFQYKYYTMGIIFFFAWIDCNHEAAVTQNCQVWNKLYHKRKCGWRKLRGLARQGKNDGMIDYKEQKAWVFFEIQRRNCRMRITSACIEFIIFN